MCPPFLAHPQPDRFQYSYFDYAKRLTGSPHSIAILLSLPLVLTMWSIFWFTVSVTSLAYKPVIPLFPPVWAYWQRYGTLSLVGCLVLVVATVGWFFRGRRDTPAKPPPISLTGIPSHYPVPDPASGPPYGTPVSAQVFYPPMAPAYGPLSRTASPSGMRMYPETPFYVMTATARPRSI